MSRRPGTRAFIVSAALHGVLLVPLVVFARPPRAIEFETVRVNLVSLPEAAAVEAEPTPAQSPPRPEPVQETPEPDVETREEPPPEREREDIERPETETPPDPPEREPRPTETAPETATGGDDVNIATEGRDFPYPEYLGNVIVQVRRYFRWNEASHPKGVIYFEITSDGGVRNIRMVRPSGNITFDFAVQGAVETAGNRGAFGPLPDGYAAPFLPVELEVEPPR